MKEDLIKKTEITVNGEKVSYEEEIDDDIFETFFGDDDEDSKEEITTDDERDSILAIIDEIEEEARSDSLDISLLDTKEIVPSEIDLDEKHSLANKIVENSLDVIKNSKMVFCSFSDDVMHGKDRSTSSKEMLIKALEVQNQANKNLIDLAKTLDGEKGGTNILIASSISPKKTGVDPMNIKNHFNKK